MNSKWTHEQRKEAAMQLWDGSNTAAGSLHLKYEWIEEALTAAPRTHFYRLVDQRCEITVLREALEGFIDDEECHFDHHGCCQTHGVSKPCCMQVAREVLEKCK